MNSCINSCVYRNFNLLFYVFIYYITSLQIFHLSEFFCTNIAQVELEILGNSSTIFRSSYGRCSIRKLLSNILWYSHENTCTGVYFLITLQVIRHVTLLKRDSNTNIFLWISRNWYEDLFWRTFVNKCIVGKCFSDQIWT